MRLIKKIKAKRALKADRKKSATGGAEVLP